jgi:L-fuculose-phosphate aldolase
LREQLTAICHRLYDKGLIAAGDGNVSCRLGEDRVLVTPTGFHKGFIQPQDLIVTDLQGHRKRGEHQPSSEFMMHALCYAERPDVGAVVHAHPPLAVALALAGVSMSEPVLSEACLVLGPVLTAPYSTPTTDEVPRTLRPYIRQANAVIMHRHGALTMGRDLTEAWHRMETLEHSAKILHAAHALGPVPPIAPAEAERLEQLARRLGIPRAPDPCTLTGPAPEFTGGRR